MMYYVINVFILVKYQKIFSPIFRIFLCSKITVNPTFNISYLFLFFCLFYNVAPVGRGMLMKLMHQRQQSERKQPDQQGTQLPSLQSDSSSLASPPTSSMHSLSMKEVQSLAIPSSSALVTSPHSISTGSQKKGSAGQRFVILHQCCICTEVILLSVVCVTGH